MNNAIVLYRQLFTGLFYNIHSFDSYSSYSSYSIIWKLISHQLKPSAQISLLHRASTLWSEEAQDVKVSGRVALPWKHDHLLSWDYKGCAQLAVVDGVAGRVRMLGGTWWWCWSRGLKAESTLQRNPSVPFVKSWWAEIPQPGSQWPSPLGVHTDCGCTHAMIKY